MIKKSFLIIFLTALLNSCNKKTNDEQKRCIGGCDTSDFRVIDYQSAWSPDGKYIAYVHGDRDISKTGIYLITPEGKENHLWHQGIGAETPCWSADGNWIAFSEGAQIWKKKLNGESLIRLTDSGRNFFPAWSPDGNWIVYDSNLDSPNGMNFIWKMSSEGANKRRIAYDIENGEVRMPSWGLNNKIVHVRYVSGSYYPEIYMMGSEGEQITRITDNNVSELYPKASVETNKVLFTTQSQNGSPQIFVMNMDGTERKKLTQTQGYTADWSPDGQYIVYTDSRINNGRLWIMKSDGTSARQLTSDDNF